MKRELDQRLGTDRATGLLAVLLLGALPHAARVPVWVSGLVVALFAWRAWLLKSGGALPGKTLLLIGAAGAAAGIYLDYGRLFGRDAGVTLLVVMLALKLLEMRTLRDAMVLILISYFLVITDFLYSQSIPTAFYLMSVVWMSTAVLLSLHAGTGLATVKRAGIMLLQAVPLAVVLFLLFPRLSGPLWGMPQDAFAGVTGLSDRMTPGSLSSLLSSDAVAFRVDFKNSVPPAGQMYWRGPVLWDFDGRTWDGSRSPALDIQHYAPQGPHLDYVVTIEPNGKRWLFALDLPGIVPPKARLTSDFQLIYPGGLTARINYDMVSYPAYHDDTPPQPFEIRRALRLPQANPRSVQFGRTLRAQSTDARDFAARVLRMFHDQEFRYTTTPPVLGESPVDEFLFDTRAGFCEHYASAFTVLMRAGGVPARVVTGYQGGEVNTVGGYLIVRQADAHAWSEIWVEGTGWLRVDPTAAVAPSRIENGIAAAVPQGESLPLMVRGDYAWLHQLRMSLDSMGYAWNQAVLGYSQERQRDLLRRAGFDSADWRQLVTLMAALSAVVTLVVALGMLRRLRSARPDAAIAAYARFCARLARLGLARRSSEGPETYRRRARSAFPEAASEIDAISLLYMAVRYGNGAAAEGGVAALQRAVGNFRPRRPAKYRA